MNVEHDTEQNFNEDFMKFVVHQTDVERQTRGPGFSHDEASTIVLTVVACCDTISAFYIVEPLSSESGQRS